MRRKETESNLLTKMNKDNKGFTLVELIVCVGILAAVSIPLVQSFSASSIANSKAQSLQNATSLAEDVMEELKGNSIDEILAKYGGSAKANGTIANEAAFDAYTDQGALANTFTAGDGLYVWSNAAGEKDFMVFFRKNAIATNAGGEAFDVVASLSKSKYSAASETADASDANSIKLPRINEIDTGCHVALSKELNAHDASAAEDISRMYNETATGHGASDVASSGTKTIQIDMAGDGSGDSSTSTSLVTVDVTITYSDASGKSLQYKIYTGTFVVDLSTGLYQPNVYLFYTPMNDADLSLAYPFANEKIIFNDYTTGAYQTDYPDPLYPDEFPDKLLHTGDVIRHDLYVAIQGSNKKRVDTVNGRNIEVIMNRSGNTVKTSTNLSTDDAATMEIVNSSGLYDVVYNRMFSNFDLGVTANDDYSKNGKLFDRKKKDRVYQVHVVLTKNGDDKVYADIVSTKDADFKR